MILAKAPSVQCLLTFFSEYQKFLGIVDEVDVVKDFLPLASSTLLGNFDLEPSPNTIVL